MAIVLANVFAAIAAVEGWEGPGTVGPAGEIGPYQITYAYWQDANMPRGTHQDCEDPLYAQEVMRKYWRRHCPIALALMDLPVLLGVHHWGPSGVHAARRAQDDYVTRATNIATVSVQSRSRRRK